MTERTTVRLPDELLNRAKRRAADEGRSLSALIEEGLHRLLDEGRPNRRAKRILPPVSKATGGLMPGIDLDDMATLLGAEDRDRFGPRR